MTRRLTFTDSSKHALYFSMLYNDAFRGRGSAKQDDRVSKEDKRSDGRIAKALKAISEPKKELPDGTPYPEPKFGEPDVRPRQLNAAGGAVDLDQPDFKRLQDYVEKSQWFAVLTDTVSDLEDWLDTAEKIEPKKADA